MHAARRKRVLSTFDASEGTIADGLDRGEVYEPAR